MSKLFSEKKVTQASALILSESGGKMPYMLLIKLLYLSDRLSIEKYGFPITFDDYFSMELGPILSNTLNLIRNKNLDESQSIWRKFISEPKNYYIELKVKNYSTGELSKAEIDLLKTVYHQYGHLNRFKLSDLLHKILPEYKKTSKGNRDPITYRDILTALGENEEEIKRIENEIDYMSLIRA